MIEKLGSRPVSAHPADSLQDRTRPDAWPLSPPGGNGNRCRRIPRYTRLLLGTSHRANIVIYFAPRPVRADPVSGPVLPGQKLAPRALLPQASSRALTFLIYLGCCTFLLAQIAFNFVDIDLWHQMNLIRASIAAGHLLTQDPFSYVPNVHPMIDHEWGAGVLALFVGRWIGGAGLLLLKFNAAFGTLLLAMRVARTRDASIALLGFLAPLSIHLLFLGFLPAVRAQAYSFLFTAVLLCVLETVRRGNSRWLWVWLLIFPLWVNLHGGFVVGLGFVVLFALEQAIARQPIHAALLALNGMVIGVFLNPYGVRYLDYLARALTMARPRVPEWGPLWSVQWSIVLAFALAVAIWLYTIAHQRTLRAPGVLLLAASVLEALLHRKMLPFFAITWLCYVPASFQATPAGQGLLHFTQKRARFLAVAWTLAIAACLTVAVRGQFWKIGVPQSVALPLYPVGAVDYLQATHFYGNVMTPFRSGAYVSWKLYPTVKVSVDSRYEVAYPDDWVERTFRFYEAAPGWRETLEAYPTDIVLLPRNSPIASPLHELGWNSAYRDGQFEIAARPGLTLTVVDHLAESFAGTFP
jgi:hypothetical protein